MNEFKEVPIKPPQKKVDITNIETLPVKLEEVTVNAIVLVPPAEIREKGKGLSFPDPECRFSGPLRVDYINGDEWELAENISYRTKGGEIATARKGFRFDFASIPFFLQWLYPKAGDGTHPYGIGSLFHDWLYCHRKIGGRIITRIEADDLFYEINRYVGIVRWTAGRMYRAVRAFGWIPWNRRKPEDIIP
jgi:hypothetical protein